MINEQTFRFNGSEQRDRSDASTVNILPHIANIELSECPIYDTNAHGTQQRSNDTATEAYGKTAKQYKDLGKRHPALGAMLNKLRTSNTLRLIRQYGQGQHNQTEQNKPSQYKDLGKRHPALAAMLNKLRTSNTLRPIRQYGQEQHDQTKQNKPSTLGAMFGQDLDWTYRCYQVTTRPITLAGQPDLEPIFQEYIYLFNIIIAFEWQPSKRNLRIVERATKRAADFLFDVTDGWMSFGQVVIGGPKLMNCADFQVLASNRILPRSWVGGLHEPKKYMPIRLGRGLWQKNNRGSIAWDEPEGYRTLVHEWSHYALELLDNYADTHQVYIPGDVKASQGMNEARRSNRELVVPSISLPVDSIMSTLEGTSELVAKRTQSGPNAKQSEWEILIDGFDGLEGKKPRFPRIVRADKATPDHLPPHGKPIEGPLPIHELPYVVLLTDTNEIQLAEELLLIDVAPYIQPDHCWVYILKEFDNNAPKRIIAQGNFDARQDGGFRLFGAKQGDHIVLIGNDYNWKEQVLLAKIETVLEPDGRNIVRIEHWHVKTPSAFPVIDVEPAPVGNQDDVRAARLKVHVYEPTDEGLVKASNPKVFIYPLDQVARIKADGSDGTTSAPEITAVQGSSEDATKNVVSLDGHVFVETADGFVIATFSQGGGPNTGSPVGGTPIMPGSAEGNLMVFFADRGEYPRGTDHHSRIKVVTTRLPGMPMPGPTETQPRSYAYSISSNAALPFNYLPTLAMFYDKRTELEDGDAVIHRQKHDGLWEPIPSYRPSGAWYVAAPLDINTAPGLVKTAVPNNEKAEHRYERYRLFWTPRNRTKSDT